MNDSILLIRLFVIAAVVCGSPFNRCIQFVDAQEVKEEINQIDDFDFSLIPEKAIKVIPVDVEGNWDDTLPGTLKELLRFEKVTTELVPFYRKATVGIQSDGGQGSGVVVSSQGHVLTAAHVVGEVGKKVTIVFPDGSRYFAKVAGVNTGADAAIVRITSKGPFKFVPMARQRYAISGRWVIATGHPNGFQNDRLPVVRLGRVITTTDKTVQTDCSLVGGDSGGPLFDMHGRVVGIHSRIGASNSINFHVPVQVYLKEWKELNAGYVPKEKKEKPAPTKAYIGIRGRNANGDGCFLSEITPSGPAAQAGLKRGDILIKCDQKKIDSFSQLVAFLKTKKPNDKIEITVLRGRTKKKMTVVLGETVK